jgi:hypothetical protein
VGRRGESVGMTGRVGVGKEGGEAEMPSGPFAQD